MEPFLFSPLMYATDAAEIIDALVKKNRQLRRICTTYEGLFFTVDTYGSPEIYDQDSSQEIIPDLTGLCFDNSTEVLNKLMKERN